MTEIQAVKCDHCGRLHETSDETYVIVSGNITRGQGGGLVGNNLNDDKVVREQVFCHPDCIAKVLGIETKYARQLQ